MFKIAYTSRLATTSWSWYFSHHPSTIHLFWRAWCSIITLPIHSPSRHLWNNCCWTWPFHQRQLVVLLLRVAITSSPHTGLSRIFITLHTKLSTLLHIPRLCRPGRNWNMMMSLKMSIRNWVRSWQGHIRVWLVIWRQIWNPHWLIRHSITSRKLLQMRGRIRIMKVLIARRHSFLITKLFSFINDLDLLLLLTNLLCQLKVN